MRYALVNPRWHFEGSIYFGCREPHLPLEFGYSKALLERAGHEARIFDGQMDGLSDARLHALLAEYAPDFTVVTTAPSYLFWRCAPPELRAPVETAQAIREVCGKLIIVGPHASTTPPATLRKTGADACVIGECEEILPMLAREWPTVPSLAWRDGERIATNEGGTHSSDMQALPALHWPREYVARHGHHHHRFDEPPDGPGAEMEASRGCPYQCTFCAKDNFRDSYRRRPLEVVLEELDGLAANGVRYVYFIDEIFLPWAELLEAVAERGIRFGMQTRIDLWNERMIELAGRAGCVSIEAGVESISELGRNLLDKRCKLSTDELISRLVRAKQCVPFVQANLIEMESDSPRQVEDFREKLQMHGVWANRPVPLFAYPGSPEYSRRWGRPDDHAWERAHADYLRRYSAFSDVQEEQPLPLEELESAAR